jgi:hypothetical protein
VGYLLLAMYLTCDSFTSQWQDKVFKKFQARVFVFAELFSRPCALLCLAWLCLALCFVFLWLSF